MCLCKHIENVAYYGDDLGFDIRVTNGITSRLVPAEGHLLFPAGKEVSNADRRETMNAIKTTNE